MTFVCDKGLKQVLSRQRYEGGADHQPGIRESGLGAIRKGRHTQRNLRCGYVANNKAAGAQEERQLDYGE